MLHSPERRKSCTGDTRAVKTQVARRLAPTLRPGLPQALEYRAETAELMSAFETARRSTVL